MRLLITTLALAVSTIGACPAQSVSFNWIPDVPSASYRGLHVLNAHVAWVSGSKGNVGRTTDGGKTWQFHQVNGYEKCDFRTLHAFSETEAVIANAGSPAYILHTTDGGRTWQKVYENKDTAAFLDGVAFWNRKSGMVYGDPIGRRLLLLTTRDGGWTWTKSPETERPMLQDGEASFAASGTTIQASGRNRVLIATGGKVSRVLEGRNRGKKWSVMNTPILQGRSGTGIFSLLPLTRKRWIIAGGDYMADTINTSAVFSTSDAGRSWLAPLTATRGYRECLTGIGNGTVLATGPTGIDISVDGGMSWYPLSDEKQLHVLKGSRKLLVAAGGSGKLAVVSLKQ